MSVVLPLDERTWHGSIMGRRVCVIYARDSVVASYMVIPDGWCDPLVQVLAGRRSHSLGKDEGSRHDAVTS